MAISSKKVFENFQKASREVIPTEVVDNSDQGLYLRFKSVEKELNELLDKKGGFAVVLEKHISFTRPKAVLFEIVTDIFSRPSMQDLIFSKHIDERFWVLIKKELRKSKLEQKNKNTLSRQYMENIVCVKENLGNLIKQSWKTLDPLKEPHLLDSPLRRLFGKLFQSLGEILKQKSKQDKSVLAEVKEFYLRSNKIYSFSSRCQELLGMCHQAIGDLFGSVYWFTRCLSVTNPASCKEQLISVYEQLRIKWEKHSVMTKVSAQPAWFVSFCLAFLRIQGILLTGVNTENLEFLFKCCCDSMDVYLKKAENPSLLVSMVIIWIFSMHVCVKDLREISNLVDHDPSVFDCELKNLSEKAFEFFSEFIFKVLEKINDKESCWVSSILIFLYWVTSYRSLSTKVITNKVKNELLRIQLILPDASPANTHLLLPEDFSIIGFLPLNYYYLAHKDYYNEPAPLHQEGLIRIESLRLLLHEVLEEDLTNKFEKADEEDFFVDIGPNYHVPELMFEETKSEKKMIVLDGPNIAVRHGNGSFSCKGIRIVVNYYTSRDFVVKVVVPEQYLIKDRAAELQLKGAKSNKIPVAVDILHSLDAQGFLIKTPPMDYDDSYCLEYAKTKNAVVVSNDRFWDHIKKHPETKNWLREHTCSFTFAGDDFLPNPDFVFS